MYSVHIFELRKLDALSESGVESLAGVEVTLSKLFCLPSKKGAILEGKNLLSFWSKLFSSRVDPL